MNTIATWFYADNSDEKSYYPQVGRKSDKLAFQRHYWRCVALFFRFLRRYHNNEEALFFTNVAQLPIVDGCSIAKELEKLNVKHICLAFDNPPPLGYCKAWRNQFYLFSIISWLAEHSQGKLSLLLDSDCVIRSSLEPLFQAASEQGFLTFLPLAQDDTADDDEINGLSKRQLGQLFAELLPHWPADKVAPYHQGEFLLADKPHLQKLKQSYEEFWPESLRRFQAAQLYFHEEAQLLSFLYEKTNMQNNAHAHRFIRRIWTDKNYARNVEPSIDEQLSIWHLPAEKKFGFRRLFRRWLKQPRFFEAAETTFQKVIAADLNLTPRTSSLIYRRTRYLVKIFLQAFKKP